MEFTEINAVKEIIQEIETLGNDRKKKELNFILSLCDRAPLTEVKIILANREEFLKEVVSINDFPKIEVENLNEIQLIPATLLYAIHTNEARNVA